jgi:hypothetical protein
MTLSFSKLACSSLQHLGMMAVNALRDLVPLQGIQPLVIPWRLLPYQLKPPWTLL